MKPLRVLHLASFIGNIGDNANHMGFRPWFEKQLGLTVEWTNLEIREFYWKERRFDESFVEMCNAHDLLVIGGGNYFELWVENSPTGTSIAIDPETFSKISVPVYFNALGVDPGQGVPDSSRRKFTAFLDTLLASDQYLVSVRNDGAMDTLATHIGTDYVKAIHHVPDGGFFASFSERDAPKLLSPNHRHIAINVANDMAETRFSSFQSDNPSTAFAAEFARSIGALGAEHADLRFVLFPHIFRDIDVIFQVLEALDDRLRRTRVIVAPYASGDQAARTAFGLYAQCDLGLGMRFHSNVCNMGAGRPTLGLACYRQIRMLYQELGQSDRIIEVGEPGFADQMQVQINATLADIPAATAQTRAALEQVSELRIAFEPAVAHWIAQNALSGHS